MQWVARCGVAFSTSLAVLGACSDAAPLEPRDENGGNGATTSTGGKDDDLPPVPGTGGRLPGTGASGGDPKPSTGGYGGYGGYGGGYGGYGADTTGGAWGTGGVSADGGVCLPLTTETWCVNNPGSCRLQQQGTLCADLQSEPNALTTSRCGSFVRFVHEDQSRGGWQVIYDERTGSLYSARARNPANGCLLVVGTPPKCAQWTTVPCWSVFPDGGAPPPVDAGRD